MQIITLNKSHIYCIHQQAILDYGGQAGVYDNTDGKIESILARQYPLFGHDKYPTVYNKAAMLIYFFAKGHCFVDGNKRVAFSSAYVFLNINSVVLNVKNEEAEDMVLKIAKSQYHGCEIDDYIKKIALKLYYKSYEI